MHHGLSLSLMALMAACSGGRDETPHRAHPVMRPPRSHRPAAKPFPWPCRPATITAIRSS
jgi:hypothetical protein